jgi:hypothetical protein
VLKKAGIVVAGTAASLLAISPLAFATDKDDHDRGHHGRGGAPTQVNHIEQDDDNWQAGLVNVGDVNALNDVNVCPDVTAAAGIGNLLGLLGGGLNESEAEGDDVTCVNDDSITQKNNR